MAVAVAGQNMTKEDEHPKTQEPIGEWVESLSKEKMPALANTVHKLGKLTTDEDSRVAQLSEQILKDPNLTSRVLQVSNSVIYRGVAGNVSTITRAIVLMGFTTIRDISLSMKILDEMLKKSPSQHLKNVLAKSFHAAMQAKGMVTTSKYAVKEEIFIAGLLYHLGEMSILSRNDPISHKLDNLISNQGYCPSKASREVLGFTFDELTTSLSDHWNLSKVLAEALKKPEQPSQAAHAVILGEELSQVVALGWDSDAVQQVMQKIAKFGELGVNEALEQAKQVADYAKEVSSMYGAESVKHLIPPSNYTQEVAERLNVVTLEDDVPVDAEPGQKPQQYVELDITPEMIEAALNYRPLPSYKDMKKVKDAEQQERDDQANETLAAGDSTKIHQEESANVENAAIASKGRESASLQLDYMQRLGNLITGQKLNVNEVFSIILEGMEQAVGLERVVMCLVSKDRKLLMPKFFRGESSEQFKDGFKFRLDEENVFAYSLNQAQSFWMGSQSTVGRAYLYTPQLKSVLQTNNFFVAPIVVSRKPIGVFYADQKLSESPLTEQQFLNFNSLAQQASMALSVLGN